jgi:hypothetical protein
MSRFAGPSGADAPDRPDEMRMPMASSSKKRTTMAKINRENAVRERRFRKQARKDARKLAAEQPPEEAAALLPEEQSKPEA